MTPREAERAKNMFALGLMSWLYGRPIESTIDFLQTKFAKRPEIAEANLKAFNTGYAFGETSEAFAVQYEVKPAKLDAGPLPADHRQHGALVRADRRVEALGARRSSSAPTRSRRRRRSSRSSRGTSRSACARSRPRTRSPRSAPRSARRSAARSASPPRPGPGVVLKSETVGLAIALELPLVIVDVQRAGPSTGMPTKPEQGDLLMVLFGRNSESPVPVLAPATPGDCFYAAIEAARVALTYRTPVYLLSDAYLANGAEPWRVPDVELARADRGRVRRRPTARSSCRTSATRRRSRGRGRSPARRGSSTGSAGSRRRTRRATSPTTPTTTT